MRMDREVARYQVLPESFLDDKIRTLEGVISTYQSMLAAAKKARKNQKAAAKKAKKVVG